MQELRLRQSYAKTLLRCPALVKRELDGEGGKKPTKAMDLGSLVDQMVFGERNYHTVDAADWRTKAAKAERDAARKAGMIPVLQHDHDRAELIAAAVKQCLLESGVDLEGCIVQQAVEWIGPHGVACTGTPDIVAPDSIDGPCVIDLKVGGDCDPDWLDRHVYDMGWDIQAAAYTEATAVPKHVVVAAETSSGLDMVTWNPLSEDPYLVIGRERWREAAAVWKRCIDTGDWPGFKGRTLYPPRWAVMKHLGADGDIAALGLEA